MARPKKNTKQPKAIASAQSLSAFVKSISDIMRLSQKILAQAFEI